MLILSRKPGETLIINNDIEVKIIEINGDKVKIGIEAPKDVKILRNELVQTVDNNKLSASKLSPSKFRSMLSDINKKD